MQMIAFDSHKRYTLASVQSVDGKIVNEERINHIKGNITQFLKKWDEGSFVAVESIGSWYWIIDEIEKANMSPRLVHPRKAKLMLGMINKTDKLDVRGLNLLQRTGTLPTVWVPPMDLRDNRELPRTRMVFTKTRTRLKNRIHSVIEKYGLQSEFDGISDIFGKKGKDKLKKLMPFFPTQTRYTLNLLLEQLDLVEKQIKEIESRMKEEFTQSEDIKLLMTIPGVGFILAVVIALEVGDITRFKGPDKLAAYSGTVPRVHASGTKVYHGRVCPDTNRYLKWAFAEAANSISLNYKHWPERHVSKLYKRIRSRRGHKTAIGAVARHLAEATYWIMTKKQPYLERSLKQVLSAKA